MSKLKFNIIVAVDDEYSIGKSGSIPWSKTSAGREDMKSFKSLTSETDGPIPILIMGRNTYNSCKDLSRRKKVMVGSSGDFNSVKSAIEYYQGHPIWVCGGASIYLEALSIGPDHIYMTHIPGVYNCDVFIKEFSTVYHIDPISKVS